MLYVLQVVGALVVAAFATICVYALTTFAFQFLVIDRWRLRDRAILEIVGAEWFVGVGLACGFTFFLISGATLPFEFFDWAKPAVIWGSGIVFAIGAFRYIYFDYIPGATRRARR